MKKNVYGFIMDRTICVVDDDQVVTTYLSHLLRKEYEVLAFNDPEEFLRHCDEAQCCAVVITDYDMPTMSGVEMLRRASAKADVRHKILMTGYRDLNIAVQAINEAQVDYILLKPFDEAGLLDTLANLMKPPKTPNVKPGLLSRDEIEALTGGLRKQ